MKRVVQSSAAERDDREVAVAAGVRQPDRPDGAEVPSGAAADHEHAGLLSWLTIEAMVNVPPGTVAVRLQATNGGRRLIA